jgi:hypothetical protein
MFQAVDKIKRNVAVELNVVPLEALLTVSKNFLKDEPNISKWAEFTSNINKRIFIFLHFYFFFSHQSGNFIARSRMNRASCLEVGNSNLHSGHFDSPEIFVVLYGPSTYIILPQSRPRQLPSNIASSFCYFLSDTTHYKHPNK